MLQLIELVTAIVFIGTINIFIVSSFLLIKLIKFIKGKLHV